MESIWSFWARLVPDYLDGLVVTLLLTVVGLAVGLPLGVLLATLGQAGSKLVRALLVVVVELGRGTPALVTLYFVYFGLPQVGITLNSMVAASIALSYTTGAYTSVIFRAGLAAVPSGQQAACDALGLSRWKSLRLVLLPQTFKLVLPPIIGWSIIMFQGTSLAFTIAVPELLSRAYEAGSLSYRFGPALTLAGLMYAAISLVALALLRRFEPRTGSSSGRARRRLRSSRRVGRI